MSRVTKLLVGIVFGLSALVSSCGDECNVAGDCVGEQICYKGECIDALLETLNCASDNDCGEAPAGGAPRAFVCVVGRCRVNQAFSSNPPPPPADSGTPPPADSGAGPAD